jgi:hypothetical protein
MLGLTNPPHGFLLPCPPSFFPFHLLLSSPATQIGVKVIDDVNNTNYASQVKLNLAGQIQFVNRVAGPGEKDQ